MEEIVYSIKGEIFDTLKNILGELKNSDDENTTTIYRGVKIPYSHSNFIDGNNIIEDIVNSAYDAFDDMSDNYCAELEAEEHTKNLEKIVLDYLNKNVKQPDFFGVKDIEKVLLVDLENQTK